MKEEYSFEWDEQKSISNGRKHGVLFQEALNIWDDPMFVEVHLVSETEDRWAVIGRVAKQRHLTAIITYREDVVRIISVRKSTKKEVDFYEQN